MDHKWTPLFGKWFYWKWSLVLLLASKSDILISDYKHSLPALLSSMVLQREILDLLVQGQFCVQQMEVWYGLSILCSTIKASYIC